MRKRVLSVLLATVMASTLMAGCGAMDKGTASEDNAKEESVEDTAETTEEDEVAEVVKAADASEDEDTVETDIELKKKTKGSTWFDQLREYYDAQRPDGVFEDEVYSLYEYSDDFRGELSWDLYSTYFEMELYNDDDDNIYVRIDTDENEADLELCIDYDDETSFDISCDELECDKITSILEDISKIDPEFVYEDSALEEHDAQTDALIMYERLIELSDKFMKKAGVGSLEDCGLGLKSTGKVKASTCLSKEVPYLVNEHKFENGICTDCEMTWSEYMTDAGAILTGDPDWSDHTGIRNEFLPSGDRVTLVEWPYISTKYSRICEKPGNEGCIYQRFSIYFKEPDMLMVELIYEDTFDTGEEDENGYPVMASAECGISFEASPGEMVGILSSGDKLLEASEYEMRSFCSGEDGFYFDDESATEAEKSMKEQNYQMISHEELCEVLSGEYKTFLLAIDKSLSEAGTSLKDTGIVIK